MKVSIENCKGCSAFENSKFQSNMLKYDTCSKREIVGCPREENRDD